AAGVEELEQPADLLHQGFAERLQHLGLVVVRQGAVALGGARLVGRQAVAAHDLVVELLAAEDLFAVVQAAAVAQDVQGGGGGAVVQQRDAAAADAGGALEQAVGVLDREGPAA